MNTKKIILIILFTLVSIGIGAALYFLFFAPSIIPEPIINIPSVNAPINVGLPGSLPTIPPVQVPGAPTPTEVPSIISEIPALEVTPQQRILQLTAQGGLTKTDLLIDQQASLAGIAGNSLAFYNAQNNSLNLVNASGETQTLTDEAFFNVENISWSPNSKKAVLEFPDGSNILYDFDTQKAITLPTHWEDFSFDTSSNKLVYKSVGIDDDNKWLAVMNSDGSGVKAIEPLGINADKVNVNYSPNGQVIAFSHTGTPKGFNQEEIYLIGQNQENFRSLIVNGQGFIPLWSPTGNQIVYSIYSDREAFRPELWIVNAQGDQIGTGKQFLNVFTYADKCTFVDNARLICAVPFQMPEKAGIFRELTQDIPDIIYEINLTENTKRILAIPELEITVNQILVSEDKQHLFLLGNNSSVYEIEL